MRMRRFGGRARASLAAAALLALGACAYAPVAVEGLGPARREAAEAEESPWLFVPVGAWITRDNAVPRAVGMCERDPCPQKVAVAVVEVRGEEARALARTLREPAALARQLEAGNRERRARAAAAGRTLAPDVLARRMPRPVAAEASRLAHGRFQGFRLTMRNTEAPARIAHAAVLGLSRGGRLTAVIVVGEAPGAVEAAARAAADANL